MEIRGFKLPDKMVEVIGTEQLKRSTGVWPLRNNVDAFGNDLETELGEFYGQPDIIEKETDMLSLYFHPAGYYQERSFDTPPEGNGILQDILDFSKIICFGISEHGYPFCLDYREDTGTPSIIWWDHEKWRLIAPDFESFLELFNLDRDG